ALAGDDAGTAAGADVEIHGHAPLLLGIERRMAVNRRQLRGQFFVARDLLYELGIFAVMLERRFAHQSAAFDAPMVLRERKRVSAQRVSPSRLGRALFFLTWNVNDGRSFRRRWCRPSRNRNRL